MLSTRGHGMRFAFDRANYFAKCAQIIFSRRQERCVLIAKCRKLAHGLAIVALVVLSCSGCRSERLANDALNPPVQQPAITSRKSGSEALPITWNDVKTSYEGVADYVCLYEKEERAISDGEKQ